MSEKNNRSGNGRFFEELDLEFLIHELKDPVSVVETGVRTLLEREEKYGPLSEKQKKTLSRILRNTQKLRDMVYDLLEIGRSEAGFCVFSRFVPVPVIHQTLVDALETVTGSVSDVLRQSTNETQIAQQLSALGITMTISGSARNIELNQDEKKFRQILGNLLKNALHHRREHMTLEVGMTDDHFTVSITDDGPGISKEHHRAIFERFFRVADKGPDNRRGHGLGLAGSMALSQCLGGTIELESKPGAGATFKLVLPCARSNAD